MKIAIRRKINSSWNNLVIAILFGVFSKVLFSLPLGFDDVYITFRYAERFGNGFGLTYNDGENVFGISNLFYSVFLGILVKTFDTSAIEIVKFTSTTAVIGLIFVFGKICDFYKLSKWHILLLQALVALSPIYLTIAFMGMETPVYSLMIMLSIYGLLRRKVFLSGLSAGITIGIRLDGIVAMLALIATLLLLNTSWQLRLKAILTFCAGMLLPAMLYVYMSLTFFGRLFPSTIETKVLQPKQASRYWMIEWFTRGPGIPATIFLGVTLMAIVLKFIRFQNQSLLLFVFMFVFTIGYVSAWTLVGIDLYPWYLSAISPLLPLCAIPLISCLTEQGKGLLLILVTICWLLTWGFFSLSEHKRNSLYLEQIEIPRREIAEIIKENDKSGDLIVGSGAPGIIGYFCGGCKIVDYGGLVSKDRSADTTVDLQVTLGDNPVYTRTTNSQLPKLAYLTRGNPLGVPNQYIYLTSMHGVENWRPKFSNSEIYDLGLIQLNDVQVQKDKLAQLDLGKSLNFNLKMKLKNVFPQNYLLSFYVQTEFGEYVAHIDTTNQFVEGIKISSLSVGTIHLNSLSLPLPLETKNGKYVLLGMVYSGNEKIKNSNQEINKLVKVANFEIEN